MGGDDTWEPKPKPNSRPKPKPKPKPKQGCNECYPSNLNPTQEQLQRQDAQLEAAASGSKELSALTLTLVSRPNSLVLVKQSHFLNLCLGLQEVTLMPRHHPMSQPFDSVNLTELGLV